MNRIVENRLVTAKVAIRTQTVIATVYIWMAITGLILLLGIALCHGEQLRSPKDAADPAHKNAPMLRQVLPPMPPGYVAPATVAAAPAPAPSVVMVAAPIAPYDILAPSIMDTQICFPVLSNSVVNFTTNAVLYAYSPSSTVWTVLNKCDWKPSWLATNTFFKLQH